MMEEGTVPVPVSAPRDENTDDAFPVQEVSPAVGATAAAGVKPP